MTTLLHLILTASLISWGFFAATRYRVYQDGVVSSQILGFVKKYGDQHLPIWIRKPLYDCPTCMGSVWSIITVSYFGIEVLSDIVPMILAVSGLNYLILTFMPDEI